MQSPVKIASRFFPSTVNFVRNRDEYELWKLITRDANRVAAPNPARETVTRKCDLETSRDHGARLGAGRDNHATISGTLGW